MGLSFIAFNRLAENKSAEDPAYRRELRRNGKPLLSQARLLTDAELLGKLRAVGIKLDKPSYRGQCERALSAEELCERRSRRKCARGSNTSSIMTGSGSRWPCCGNGGFRNWRTTSNSMTGCRLVTPWPKQMPWPRAKT